MRIGHPRDRSEPRRLGLRRPPRLLGKEVGVVLRRKRLCLHQKVAEVLLEGAEVAEREHAPAAGLDLGRPEVGEGRRQQGGDGGGDEVCVGGPGRASRGLPQRRGQPSLRRGPREPEEVVQDAGVELEAWLVEGVGHDCEDLSDEVHVVRLESFFVFFFRVFFLKLRAKKAIDRLIEERFFFFFFSKNKKQKNEPGKTAPRRASAQRPAAGPAAG